MFFAGDEGAQLVNGRKRPLSIAVYSVAIISRYEPRALMFVKRMAGCPWVLAILSASINAAVDPLRRKLRSKIKILLSSNMAISIPRIPQ
jgi:hypothetical protein